MICSLNSQSNMLNCMYAAGYYLLMLSFHVIQKSLYIRYQKFSIPNNPSPNPTNPNQPASAPPPPKEKIFLPHIYIYKKVEYINLMHFPSFPVYYIPAFTFLAWNRSSQLSLVWVTKEEKTSFAWLGGIVLIHLHNDGKLKKLNISLLGKLSLWIVSKRNSLWRRMVGVNIG